MSGSRKSPWRVWVDTGGTFTDCIAISPQGERKKAKVLSSSALRGEIISRVDDLNFKVDQSWEAPTDFIEGFGFELLDGFHQNAKIVAFDSDQSVITLDKPVEVNEGVAFEALSDEEAPVLAARLVTQTPRQDSLPAIDLRLATTKATNALLEKKGAPTALFVTKGYGDLLKIGTQQRPDLFALEIEKKSSLYDEVVEVDERLNAVGEILKPIDIGSLKSDVKHLLDQGITSAAVSLMHSYKNPKHEQQFKKWLLDQGFEHVSVSANLSPFIGILPRTETALVNAYLAPIIQQYLDDVQSVIKDEQMFIMTSAGGLTLEEQFAPKDSLLSGPAGGVVGAATAGKKAGVDHVISFDMGGTSTDVARYDAGYEYVFEHAIGDAHLVAPALNIETVAAGGGSICYFDGHKLCVGPESAGAWPGPACYGAGGPLTVTDVNLLLGRLDPQNFHIPVDLEAANTQLNTLLQEVKDSDAKSLSRQEMLSGFLQIANERMADAIRKVSVQKGYDTRNYGLVAFGGAGGQHACAIADRLNMETVIIPEEAGLLSAEGLGHAEVEEFAERQILRPLHDIEADLEVYWKELADQAKEKLTKAGISAGNISIRRNILSMRLSGQETSLEVEYTKNGDPESAFKDLYREQYGHWVSGREIEVVSLRVIASADAIEGQEDQPKTKRYYPDAAYTKEIWFEGESRETPVFLREKLKAGAEINGPALILDPHSTIAIEPNWEVAVTADGALKLSRSSEEEKEVESDLSEVVSLELFTNRFSSIAVEMGEMLQRTALSVNVKDRLDFSCALLNEKGELVVNAPHIPVHLGALGLCVRRVKEELEIVPGDVLVTNHPAFGGSHLPDVTVITPCFVKGNLVGFAASRAHHAEIGGASPGSMPPTATNLQQEGVVIPPMHLVKKGEGQWQKIKEQLLSDPFPTRSVSENIADLQAAVAANQRGIDSLEKLCEKHSIEKVRYYMDALTAHAESKMRSTIKEMDSGQFVSEEFLDDGTPIKVKVEVDDDEIELDFTGTGAVHPGNLNATPAIVSSVVMYVLRLLIDESIPLNEGILKAVNMTLPKCLLNPAFDADPKKCPAVVGGNIEVSQRLVDTLLKPFERIACSQGTMNNVLFGNEDFGYYETVGGGTGAGPGFSGTDAVHHHMTNTRGTDPEIFEYRYPVRLDEYSVRKNSGGDGKWKGGNGIYRKVTFLENVELTVLTQHRREGPYGVAGGEAGSVGEQWVYFKDGNKRKLDSIDGCSLEKGDSFILKTPGGGGFGNAKS
ncbi:hydantoinase B/oxoprolinase family protein [Fodinibius halophilus]|uniref:5-oxoprolinase n=1 Tax=Fodinibius halophilus TaxID=1736908 RepID=A0A6M1T1P2_9BACT|nr:hydantoinase B/oxoprolinase family protein [Fodinibius halophilus]NGP89988.1 5-oxoprolinase [Fodinibius halophilus]